MSSSSSTPDGDALTPFEQHLYELQRQIHLAPTGLHGVVILSRLLRQLDISIPEYLPATIHYPGYPIDPASTTPPSSRPVPSSSQDIRTQERQRIANYLLWLAKAKRGLGASLDAHLIAAIAQDILTFTNDEPLCSPPPSA